MDTSIQKTARTPWRTGSIPQIGLLVDVGTDGSPIVEYSGNDLGPIPARTVIPMGRQGDTVLLVFDQGDPTRPIIIGIVHDRFETSQAQRLKMAASEILLEGEEEISLRCGESSLTLRKDGKTVLKGREVLSRAARTNRIKGATVQIN
jgi:hypothetical protein